VANLSAAQLWRRLMPAGLAVPLVLVVAAGARPVAAVGIVPRPPIVWRPIPFPPTRKAEMAAYSERHYGIDSWRLVDPKVIVEHYTANDSFSATWNTFAANDPDPELNELPGDCAHFVVDTDGTIYQLVSLATMCRHTVGLNYTAIGIEHVATSDEQVLSDPRELAASLWLTLWLMQRYHIRLANVIGHNESLTSPYHHELVAAWRCQTHADWNRADMQIYRGDLIRLARRYDVAIGSPAPPRPVPSGC
jgi:N-acetylmuramoyl-L-alanine amidase